VLRSLHKPEPAEDEEGEDRAEGGEDEDSDDDERLSKRLHKMKTAAAMYISQRVPSEPLSVQ
jgi:hypothetical protein